MYELNGEEITLETLQGYANQFGMDVDSYIEFMKGQGLVEKTEGVAATDAAVTPTTDTESASENIFSELPEVTKEDVGLGERYFVDRFNKTYEGIGYKATQATLNEVEAAGFQTSFIGRLLSSDDKEYKGDFQDFVTITSPPDADGNTTKKTVKVDKDFGIPRFGIGEEADEVGGMQQFLGFNFGGKTADEINEFIQSNLKNSNVNPETYSYAWNMANTKPVVIDGKERKLDDLNPEELTQHVENIFADIIGSGNIPGAQKIQEDIKPEIQKFSNELLEVYKEKVANGELDYQEATNEFNEAVSKRYGELFEESDEWKKLTSTLEKAVGSRFNKDFTDKIRIEAENEHLPDWVANNFSEDFVRQAYITSRIKIPKTIDETQILFRTRELNDVREEIKELSLNPEAKYDSKQYSPFFMPRGGQIDVERRKELKMKFETNQDRIDYLQQREARLNQLIGNDLLQQNEYQQKLKDLKVPSAFGKTIDDPDLTLDEWQGMLGDQTVQMIGAMFTVGGSTFVQEGGGAAFEILEVEAAKKMKGMSIEDFFGKDPDDIEGVKKKFNLDDSGNKKPTSEDIEMKLKAFRALPFEDVIENGKVKVRGRKSRIQDVIDSGEVNMTEAIFVGGITAGLDLVSTFSAFKGATKLIPKSLLRDIGGGRFSQAYKTFTKPTKDVLGKKAASPAKTIGFVTGVETVTEMAQELTSMSGVKAATGYFPSKDKALKRIYEAGAQALLTTGPITVGGQTVTTTFNETVLTRIKGLPQASMRQAINARKDQLRQQNAAGFISKDKMLDQFTELEAIENSIGTLKLSNKLNLEERIEVVNLFKKVKEEQDKVDEIKKNFDEKKNEELLQEKDQVISEEELAILEGETAVKKAQDKIRKVFFANSFRTNGMRLAELINTADKGPLKDSKMFVFDTPEEARNNLEVLGFSQDQNGRWRFKGKFTKRSESNLINKIVNGSANAGFFNMQGLSKTGIFVTKNINEKIDQGVLNAFNAVQHETMHGLSSDLTFEQLKAITEGLTKEMKAGDAKMQAALKQVQRILKDLDLSKDNRTYHDEFLGYLSDTFHALDINQEYLTKDNAASLFNMSKYFQTGYQELLNTSQDVVKMSPSQLIEFIRGFNINKQTVNISMPKPKGVDAQEDVKPAQKQGSLLSEQLYQQLTRDFENAVEEYSSLVGEEEAKTLAANIAASRLGGEAFNRIPKILLEGFTQEDLQDVVDDFTSDPKVLAKKGEEYNKIKNRGVVGLLKKYNVGFEGGVMGYLNSKQGGFSIFDLRLAEFVRAHPSYGNITISTAQEGAIGAVDQVTDSLSPEDILIQQEEQTQQEERQSRDGTIMLHEQAEKAGIPLTPAFEKALELLTDLYQEGKLTETGLKDLKKKFPKQYDQVYSLVQEAFDVKPKPGNLTQADIQNSQRKMQIATPTFFRKYVFMKQYTAGVAKVDANGNVVFDKDNNVVIDKDTQYLATGVPSGLQTQRVTQANNIKVAEDLFYETIMRMADKGPQKGKLIPKRPKNLVIKKLKNFDDKFFNENMGIIRGEVNIKQKESNMSQKHRGVHHMMTLELMSQAARQNMPKGRDFDMLADGLPSSLASDFIYKLDPELFKEFMGTYQAINDVMGIYANSYDKSSLKDVLRNKLSAAFSNPMITKLTNVLDPIYAQYSVDLAKVEKGLITVEELPTLNQTLETELVQDIVLSNTLDIRNDDGTKAQSMDEVWSNIGHVTKMRQSTSLFAEKLISDFGQQKGLELIVKYLLPSVVGSGRIADGRFDVIDGVLVEVGIEKASRNRKKLFKNLEDFFNSDHGVGKLLDGYLNVELKQINKLDKDGNPVKQISEIFVGDTKIEINTTLLAQKSSSMLSKISKQGELSVKNESKKQAEEAMQYVDDIIRFFNEANYLNDTHVAMMLNGLNSDMKSPMRRAARFMYVVEGVETYKNPGQTLEYEHMIPAQWQMMRHVAQVRDGSLTKENLSELYDQYTVAIIPRVMDLVIKNSGFNATMQPGYEIGQHSSGRYYNLRTLGRSNMFAIRELGSNNIFGEYHQMMAGNFDYNYKNYQNADKAINTALASEEVRGMSTFDFDDTLAYTKSGIRFTKPNNTGKPQPRRKAILLVGPAGAGKTTIINKLGLRKQGFKYVNQDVALDWLSKNSGLPQNMNDFTREQSEKWRDLQYEAASTAKDKAAKLRGKGDGVIIDSTGGDIRAVSRDFKDAGYDVQVLYVNSSLENALARNKARTERRLTDTTVRNSYEKVQKSLKGIKELVNFFPYSVKEFVEVNVDNIKQGEALPASFVEKVNNFTTGYIKERINAEEFAAKGAELLAQGAKFDFSEFNKVVDGTPGPLLQKMKNQIEKYGAENVYVLTARPAESAGPIQQFLKDQGVNIPLKNITGLGNSTGEAKAMWMLEKFAEGYNDMYFVDDAISNVEAVKNVLDQLDIKSKVRQATSLASEEISNTFNDILEDVTGIESKKRFSQTKARKRGAKKGRFRLFIPPSHEDFIGLLYNFMGKGEAGNKHREFFENTLVRPLNRAYKELNAAKQAIATDYKNLIKNSGDIKKKLRQKLADGDFTFEDAVRVYLWDKHGLDIPGIAPTDQKKLVEAVMMDQKLRMFAEVLNVISKQDEYIAPYDGWEGGSIKTDLNEAMGATGRKKFFEQFLNNANTIFSPENLNKIEAAYGPNFREALEDMLYRIETGRNRPQGQGRMLNKFMNWLNGSVASVMFLNMRSALLQQMSIVNFINFADNNIYAAAKAFANQKQYWNDWAFIFNSDFLKERRKGIGTDINGNDLARSLQDSRNPVAKLFQMLLRAGFAPTQIADNVAIATGGSTFYRNRINSYLKDGLSQKEAEQRAFEDFQEIAEETQQSAREDKVSMQQASWVGKVILNFQNVTSQYNRIGKRSFLDIKNRRISKGYKDQRTSDLANISRIAYYFAVQNLIFYGLQSALFAAMFDDEEEGLSEEERLKRKKVLDKKSERIINGSIDSVLRGSGIFGAIISVLKNMAIKYADERNKDYNPDESAVLMEALNVSPVVGIKARKIVIAEKTMNYDKNLIEYMDTWDIDNPMWQANFAYTEAVTNAPLAKTHNKVQNVRDAIQLETTMLNRILMFFGYSKYNLGVEENIEMQLLEQKAKEASKEKKRKKKKTQQPTFSF